MASKQDRSKRLLWIVNSILDPPDDLDADELSAIEDEFCDSIIHPGGAALLHYPSYWGLGDSPSAQEIADEAINWKPRIVNMTIASRHLHFKKPGFYVYEVTSASIRTQVVSNQDLAIGEECEVALSGATLRNGKVVKHGFIDDVFSASEIVSVMR